MIFDYIQDVDDNSSNQYDDLFSNSKIWIVLWKSIRIAAFTALISVMLSFSLVYQVEKFSTTTKNILYVLLILPFFIPSYIHSIAWINLLGSEGFITNELVKPFFPAINISFLYGLNGVVFLLALALYPIPLILLRIGLINIDSGYLEAALLKESRYKVFIKILFPFIRPYLIFSFFIVFVLSLSQYGIPSLLQTHTYPMEIFIQFSAFYNEKCATALCVPLLILNVFILLLADYGLKGRGYVSLEKGNSLSSLLKTRDSNSFISYLPILIIISMGSIVPIGSLISSASIAVYKSMFFIFIDPFITTLLLSGVSSVISVLIGITISYYLLNVLKRTYLLHRIIILIPIAVPGTIIGISLIRLCNHPETQFIYQSPIMLIAAYVIRIFPYTFLILFTTFGQIPKEYDEVARFTESSIIKRKCRYYLPLAFNGILLAWFIGIVLCLGELDTIIMVCPPGYDVLSLRIYDLIHYGEQSFVHALCMLQIIVLALICLILFTTISYYNKWNRK